MVRGSLLSFEDFALNSVVARGGFCTVYRGVMLRGARAGESCAVKAISDNAELLRNNESTMRGLVREVVTLTVVTHPNIVSVLGYCWTPLVCLVMEFCPNGTLADLLGTKGLDLTWGAPLLGFATQAAEAIAHLHGLDITHRDIKVSHTQSTAITMPCSTRAPP